MRGDKVMPVNNSCILPKMKSWDEFENAVCEYAIAKYNKSFIRYGRQGQKQYGIDIVSSDGEIVIQCKNYANQNTQNVINKIESDYLESKKLPFTPKKFIIATALNEDTKIIDLAIKLNSQELAVEIMFWEEISSFIISNMPIMRRYYPFLCLDNRNYVQLFSFAFFGTQIAELIGLTLGERNETSKYCNAIKGGIVWVENQQQKMLLVRYLDAVEQFALGDLLCEQIDYYESTEAYYWGLQIEQTIGQLLETLNQDARPYFLAGFYLGNFARCGLKDKAISQRLCEDFLKIVEQLAFSFDEKKIIEQKAEGLLEPENVFVVASKLYDYIRLKII